MEHTEARTYFPRGLHQPQDGFRFSMDALLLAGFAGPGGATDVVDLGCGCGVVGLGLLLRSEKPRLCVAGVDVNQQMLSCAIANADSLGFAERFAPVHCDVAAVRTCRELGPEQADLVVCNPPYRVPGTGKRPPDAGKDTARFEAVAPVADFVTAAGYLVRNRRRVCFIGLPERLPELFADMKAVRLEPKRVRFVHSRAAEASKLVLVEAVKNASAGLVVEPALALYEGQGDATRMTSEALAFCPFLACNA